MCEIGPNKGVGIAPLASRVFYAFGPVSLNI